MKSLKVICGLKGGDTMTTVVPERLKALRGNKTQKEVADSIGISQSTYAMYETGERTPSDENKRKLAMLFRKTVQEIFLIKKVTISEPF